MSGKKKRMGGPSWDKQFLKAKRNGFKGSKADWWAVRVAAMKRGHAKPKNVRSVTAETGRNAGSRRYGVARRIVELVAPAITAEQNAAEAAEQYIAKFQESKVVDEVAVTAALTALSILSQVDRTELRKRMAAVGEWK